MLFPLQPHGFSCTPVQRRTRVSLTCNHPSRCSRRPADMLKTCEQFPEGCIIFLDELDALATSRSTGEVAQRMPGMQAPTARTLRHSWRWGFLVIMARFCQRSRATLRGTALAWQHTLGPCVPARTACLTPSVRANWRLQRCMRRRGGCWVCCCATWTALTPTSAPSSSGPQTASRHVPTRRPCAGHERALHAALTMCQALPAAKRVSMSACAIACVSTCASPSLEQDLDPALISRFSASINFSLPSEACR